MDLAPILHQIDELHSCGLAFINDLLRTDTKKSVRLDALITTTMGVMRITTTMVVMKWSSARPRLGSEEIQFRRFHILYSKSGQGESGMTTMKMRIQMLTKKGMKMRRRIYQGCERHVLRSSP